MKENIVAITEHSQFSFTDFEEERSAFFQIGAIGVAFVDLTTNHLIMDDDKIDECLEEYSHEHWDSIKKNLIGNTHNAINIIRKTRIRATYMQVCADYLDSLEEAEDRLNTFIRDLESKGNQYLD